MSKIKYLANSVTRNDLTIIIQAIPILEEYYNAGYRMTLRQLHYQFVSHHGYPNTNRTYKKICAAIQHGRMGGLIDWDIIEDRTRNLRTLSTWDDPADILATCATQFHTNFWKNQTRRVEIWIEKDALIGVVENTCKHWDCPIFSCRGYSSISELHEAALRIKEHSEIGQGFRILYCGDHDPSGLDMDDAITQRLKDFGANCEFKRISLNMEQIKRFNLPPNSVKKSDTRARGYRKLYGDHCWELDALSPQELNEIVESAIIESIDDMDDFEYRRQDDIEGRRQLNIVGNHFLDAYQYVQNKLCE